MGDEKGKTSHGHRRKIILELHLKILMFYRQIIPLIDPNDDRLGYAPFAKNLANSICQMSPPDGFVMAVYGPWGSGKSTLLNFIVHYLEQKPESEQPIIVPFNPWWFSGQEDLTKRFFGQLQAVLVIN
jgi:predicted KAP-like P-loop ATPase